MDGRLRPATERSFGPWRPTRSAESAERLQEPPKIRGSRENRPVAQTLHKPKETHESSVNEQAMRTNLLTAFLGTGLVLVSAAAVGQSTNGSAVGKTQATPAQQRPQDRLQTSSPEIEQKRTRIGQSLPPTVQQAVQDMKQARERYQQQLQEKKKELTASTAEERERLREQLRAIVTEQTRDREQLRERLQALREALPGHDQLLEQAREQVQQRERRGD